MKGEKEINTGDIISVRDLIKILIEYPMDFEVIVKNSRGKRLHNVILCARQNPYVLGCLFG